MSFIDLATVEVVEEVSENAYMLVEDGGDVKRTGMPEVTNGTAEVNIIKYNGTSLYFNNEQMSDVTVDANNNKTVASPTLYNKIMDLVNNNCAPVMYYYYDYTYNICSLVAIGGEYDIANDITITTDNTWSFDFCNNEYTISVVSAILS